MAVTPVGYERRTLAAADGMAVTAAAAWLEEILGSGLTLHQWAGARNGVETLRGRGTVFSIAAPCVGPDARTRWAVRHYRRGGAVASYLGDRYLGRGIPDRSARSERASRPERGECRPQL